METEKTVLKHYVTAILFDFLQKNKQLVSQSIIQITIKKESTSNDETFESKMRKELPTFFTNGQFRRRLEELYLI